MDFRAAGTEHTAAVPLGGDFAVGMVLRGGAGSGREFAIDAVDGRGRLTRTPFYGIRRMGWWLGEQGYAVNAKRVRRLMRQMGLEAIYPEATASDLGLGRKTLPVSAAPSQDRSTRPRLGRRYHLHSPAAGLCLSGGDHGLVQPLCAGVGSIDFVGERLLRGGLDWALTMKRPEIFNTDQGAQFTSEVFTNRLEKQDITISMDGRGRAIDNIFIERLWRTVKYEEVYLKDYVDVLEAVSNLKSYFIFYNHERPHQSLGYQTPAAIYFGKVKCA